MWPDSYHLSNSQIENECLQESGEEYLFSISFYLILMYSTLTIEVRHISGSSSLQVRVTTS